ncbi:MAG TPA: transaldolase [Chthoniobacterales bacterium]|nr:transaldolase [Chthoniobacterales bacterium]
MKTLESLSVKIFADGADLPRMAELASHPLVKGFTTNPTMMRAAGVHDYESFARRVLETVGGRPVSFEVFSDEIGEMHRQARKIAAWGSNVYVKIPITNTRGEGTEDLVRRLTGEGIKLNLTALMTLPQVASAQQALGDSIPAYISIFAGRIADTGVDPVPMVREAVAMLAGQPNIELIWASPRELLNIFHADSAGCHIITATPELLQKMALVGKNLDEFSLDTVKMFHRDAAAAGLAL